MRRLDAWVSQRHYWPHVEPIWKALPEAAKGTCWVGPGLNDLVDPNQRIRFAFQPPRGEITLVAGYADLLTLEGRSAVLAQHGAGQSYAGDPSDSIAYRHPSYSGGIDHENVELFLCPSEYSANRWREFYNAEIAVIGCPKLDNPPTEPDDSILIACNWGSQVCPESGSAFPDLIPFLPALREHYGDRLIGHGHPRAWPVFERFFAKAGIEYRPKIPTLPSLVVADNTSMAWELAALGVPVLWVDGSRYRDVPHGLRFGDTGGMPIVKASEVLDAIPDALKLKEESTQAGQAAYSNLVDGKASDRAVLAILSVL